MLRKWLFRFVVLGVVLGGALVLFVPSIRTRAESIPYRLETWWRELQPHDLYVPPPRESASADPASPVPSPTAQSPTIRPSDQPTIQPTDQPANQPTTQPTSQPANRPTTQPSNHPTIQPSNYPTIPPPPPQFRLANFKHEYQRWNNCGPVTVGMLLSHYGFGETQTEIAPILKPNPNDKNVNPDEMAAYVRAKPNFDALVLVNGNLDIVRRLIANGFPVVVEMWFLPRPNDGMGHYRLLFAYDDAQEQFSALDSYNGPNVKLSYADFDADWKVFNRTYIVAYPRERLPLVRAITGYTTEAELWQQAVAHARIELNENGDDAFAWYNLGSGLSALGQHAEAASAFDRARRIGLPWRMLWYQFAIFDSYLAVVRHQDVLDLTAASLRQSGDLEESHYYRGRALEALGRKDEALKAYREALKFNPNYQPAAKAIAQAN